MEETELSEYKYRPCKKMAGKYRAPAFYGFDMGGARNIYISNEFF